MEVGVNKIVLEGLKGLGGPNEGVGEPLSPPQLKSGVIEGF